MIDKVSIHIPILVVGFNRPHCIKKILEQLESFQPEKVYFSIDGPRDNRPDDQALVADVIKRVKNLTWKCEAHYLIREKNVGAEVNVSAAISWVLKTEEYVIVNEDDIYAPYSFYRFEQDMLIKYKNYERIGMISGGNFTPIKCKTDYVFSRYGHTGCGWGTWKRVWELFDLSESIDLQTLSINYLNTIFPLRSMAERTYSLYSQLYSLGAGNVNWDYMFSYVRLKHNLYSIVPSRPLTSNIGVVGLHARSYSLINFTKYDENYVALVHPNVIQIDDKYDIYHWSHYLRESKFRFCYNMILTKILSIFKYNDKYYKDFFGEEFFNNR